VRTVVNLEEADYRFGWNWAMLLAGVARIIGQTDFRYCWSKVNGKSVAWL